MSLVKYYESPETNHLILSLGEGDLLLESIEQVAKQAGIHTGVVLTGLGSLTHANFHYLGQQMDLPGPLEIVSLNGIIANYEPHIHLCLIDKTGTFLGGHLKAGCPIMTVGEISIMRTPEVPLMRRIRDGSRVPLLDKM